MGTPPGKVKGGGDHRPGDPSGGDDRGGEQRFRRMAVCACPVAVCGGPGNLLFEQANAFAQFVLRVGVERFPCQKAGNVALAAREII